MPNATEANTHPPMIFPALFLGTNLGAPPVEKQCAGSFNKLRIFLSFEPLNILGKMSGLS